MAQARGVPGPLVGQGRDGAPDGDFRRGAQVSRLCVGADLGRRRSQSLFGDRLHMGVVEGAGAVTHGFVAWCIGGLVLFGASLGRAQSGPPLPRLMNDGGVNARWSRSDAVELSWSVIIPV